MPTFDPTVPVSSSIIESAELRDNFNALKDLIDALPATAGGDASGTLASLNVTSIAHVSTGPAVYPAGSAANLTNVPAPATLKSGVGTLDGGGSMLLPSLIGVTAVVMSWLNTAGSGVLFNNTFSSIQSSAGAADAGLQVNWVAF